MTYSGFSKQIPKNASITPKIQLSKQRSDSESIFMQNQSALITPRGFKHAASTGEYTRSV